MIKAAPNIPVQAAELHVFSAGESVDLNFSLRYSAMKVTHRISSTTNNIIKTKRALEGFRVSGSPKERKGILAIPVYFSIFSFNLLNHDSAMVFFKECRTYMIQTPPIVNHSG